MTTKPFFDPETIAVAADRINNEIEQYKRSLSSESDREGRDLLKAEMTGLRIALGIIDRMKFEE